VAFHCGSTPLPGRLLDPVEAEFERIAPEFVAQHPRSESATRLATASHTQTACDVVFIRGAGGTRTRYQRITKRPPTAILVVAYLVLCNNSFGRRIRPAATRRIQPIPSH
jgi:hypothetical protein